MDIPKYSINNILVVQIGKLGDMVLTTPLFRELKFLYPNSKLTVLCSEQNYGILQNRPDVDNILIYKKNFFSLLRLLFTLKNRRYDLWIDPKNERSDTSKFLLKYAKPVHSLGYNFDEKIFEYDLSGKEIGKHAVDIYLTPVKVLNPAVDFQFTSPIIDISHDSKVNISDLLKDCGECIFINLSAGQPARQWNINNWVEAINGMGDSNTYTFLLNTYGLTENELNLLSSSIKQKYTILDHLTQLELAESIRRSKIVISPDTSAIHFASAFNIPAIDLMNNVPWNIERFAPLSDKHKVLISNNENSLDSITPKQVITAFKELVI
jgi:ADP-heptose:LPS heptosyltransferase